MGVPPRRGRLWPMKSDIYTKAVLTLIAVALCAIACKPFVSPEITVKAQSSSFAGVQMAQAGLEISFFDTKNGEVWHYGFDRDAKTFVLVDKIRLVKLGQPMEYMGERKK